jgi:IS30 family transposase
MLPGKRELKRERHEEGNRKQEAAQNDNFLTTQLKTSWTQRTLQLRQSINLLSSRQQDAERAAAQAKAAAAAAVALPPPTAPITTPH